MITKTKTNKLSGLLRHAEGNIYIDFAQFIKEVRKHKFKSKEEYQKNRENYWPSAPHSIYKDKGWKSWCDFLGKEEQFKQWPEFKALKRTIKGKFKTIKEYQKNRNKEWPSLPHKV